MLISYCESLKTTFTSGISGIVSLKPFNIPSSQSSILSQSSVLSPSSQSSSRCIDATYFTGAGIYLWWQLGVAQYLKENTNLADCDLPIIGASAGSLTATMLLTDVDFNHAKNVAIRLAKDCKVYERGNLVGVLGSLLRQWLEEIIPNNIEVERLSNLHIALTTLTNSKLVTGFKNKDDLVDACMASCHLPVLLDGSVLTNYRGQNVLDGSFWYFITKNRFTGLPLLNKKSNYFWIDYGDDERFMKSITGNIIELVDEDKLESMMKMGYNHMKREHAKGNLPFSKHAFPNPSINDIVSEENMSNFFFIKTIGNLALNSNEIQTLINDDNNNNNNNNDNNNNNNNNKSIKPSRWRLAANYPGEQLEPLAATISSLFSGDKGGNIDISDMLLLTTSLMQDPLI